MAYSADGNNGASPNSSGGAGGGIAAIAEELAGLSRAIAKEQLEAEKKMAPAKAEKQISAKGA